MRARAGLTGIAAIAATSVLAGCDLVFPPATLGRDAPPGPDDDAAAVADAPTADAVPSGPFKTPVRVLLGQTLPQFATDPTLTGDEQRLTFVVASTAGGATSVWTGQKTGGPIDWGGGIEEPFGTNKPTAPEISADGLTIGFAVEVTAPNFDIRSRRRDDVNAAWVVSTDYDALNSGIDDRISTPAIGTLRVMRFRRNHPGPGSFVEMQRTSVTAPWTQVIDSLMEVDAAQPNWHKHSAHLSPDGLTLVYAASPDNATPSDLYIATRATLDVKFTAPAPIDELNHPVMVDSDPWLSADGTRIYFTRADLAGALYADWGIYYSERSAL